MLFDPEKLSCNSGQGLVEQAFHLMADDLELSTDGNILRTMTLAFTALCAAGCIGRFGRHNPHGLHIAEPD